MQTVNTKILFRDWNFKCRPSEREELEEATLRLDDEMQKINKAKLATGYQEIAILAALNFSYRLQKSAKTTKTLTEIKKSLLELRANLSQDLQRLEQDEEKGVHLDDVVESLQQCEVA
jgi:cell division protein ZapA (FtsZ GTPase activity inhibitor)